MPTTLIRCAPWHQVVTWDFGMALVTLLRDLASTALLVQAADLARATPPFKVDAFCQAIRVAITRFFVPVEVAEVTERLQLDYARICFKSSLFNVKLAGFKSLVDYVKLAGQYTEKSTAKNVPSFMVKKVLVTWLQDYGVIEEVRAMFTDRWRVEPNRHRRQAVDDCLSCAVLDRCLGPPPTGRLSSGQ